MTLPEVIYEACKQRGLTPWSLPLAELNEQKQEAWQQVADAGVEFMAAEIKPLPKRKRRDGKAA